MKYIILVLSLLLNGSCSGQQVVIPDEVPYGPSPETPSLTLLDKVVDIDFDSLTEKKETRPDGKIIRIYSLDGKLFNGWALKIFPDTDHRFRYIKMEEGLMTWQVGYYDNGDLDLDFHHKNGYNTGSQRMWRKQGHPYIDTYFLEGAILHGPQLRWHGQGIMARDANFDNGTLIYEVLFDEKGQIIEKKGKVPPKYN